MMDFPIKELIQILAGKKHLWLGLLDADHKLIEQVEPKKRLLKDAFHRLEYVFDSKGTSDVVAVGCFDSEDATTPKHITMFPSYPKHLRAGDLLRVSYVVQLDQPTINLLKLTVPFIEQSLGMNEPVEHKEPEKEEEKLPDGTKRVIEL